jgi:hypothetical protein
MQIPGGQGLWVPLGSPSGGGYVGTTPPVDSSFRWGTVTDVDPLEVQLDGDTVPMGAAPDNVGDVLAMGDRVWTQLYGRRVVVLGRSTSSIGAAAITNQYQRLMTGGGIRGVDSIGIKWSQRLILMGAGKNARSLSGYFEVTLPPDGTVIPVHNPLGGASTSVVASGRIPMTVWWALYYDVPLGQTATSDPARFHIVNYSGTDGFEVPETWVLICVRNGDSLTSAYMWGDGRAQDYYHDVTLTNSWVVYGSGWSAPGYKMEEDGSVLLRGLMKNGTVGANVAAFTMPAGLGPAGDSPDVGNLYIVPSNGGVARLDVHNNGEVCVMGVISGTTAFVSLAGVRWYPAGA